MLTVYGDLIGRTIEAYVDDIVVKSKQANHLLADLEQSLRKAAGQAHQTQALEMHF
jgi:hypothetical protein